MCPECSHNDTLSVASASRNGRIHRESGGWWSFAPRADDPQPSESTGKREDLRYTPPWAPQY